MPFICTTFRHPFRAARFLGFIVTLAIGLAADPAVCQNLVPNGSFEEGAEGYECPNYIGFFDLECAHWYASIQDPTLDWENWPNPDWFHTCSSIDALSPPNVAFGGYQVPFDGEGYAGICTFNPNVNSIPELENYREYIGVELSEPLAVGQNYLVEFKIARLTAFASDKMGFKFTTYPYFESAAAATDNFAHFFIDSVITDTLNWLEVSTEFTADSAYSHFHIGNFFDDEHTTVIYYWEYGSCAYYVVDDVKISTHLNSTVSRDEPNEIKVFPNPTNHRVHIKCPNHERIESVQIHSMKGVCIYDANLSKGNSNYCTIDLSGLPQGIHSLRIKTDKSTYHDRIVKVE